MDPVLNVKSNMVESDTRHILWAAFGVSLKMYICVHHMQHKKWHTNKYMSKFTLQMPSNDVIWVDENL